MNHGKRIQALVVASLAVSGARAQSSTPWKMLVWVSTRATVVSQVDGIRQDRFFLNEPELDRVRETLDLFEKAAEAESSGKLDIQIDLKTDPVPFYRFPGQKSDPLVSSISGRFNEAAFDSDDKTPRGPYSSVLVVDPQPGAWEEDSALRKLYPAVSRRFGTSIGFVSLLATNGGAGASALLQDFLAVWRAQVAARTGFEERWSPTPDYWSSVPAPGAVVRAPMKVTAPLGVFSPLGTPGVGIFGDPQKIESENGSGFKVTVAAGIREGEIELQDGLEVDLTKTPILEFWIQSNVKDPLELRLGVGDSRIALGYYPGAKVWFNSNTGEAWKRVRLDLSQWTQKSVTQIVLGVPEETRRLESSQLGARAVSLAGIRFVAADGQSVDNPSGPPDDIALARQLAEGTADPVAALNSDQASVRISALYQLATRAAIPDESTFKRLQELSKNSEPLVSMLAIKAMGRMPSATIAAALQYALEVGPFEHCRLAAAEVLGETATDQSAPLLATMLTAREWRSRLAGVAGLAKHPNRETTIILLAMLPDPEPEVRRTICEGVDLKMDLANRRLLFVAVNDPVEAVRIAAYRRLLTEGLDEFKAEAMKGVREESPYVRSEILKTMGAKPVPAFRRYVLLGLGDRDPRVRLEAISALGKQPGSLKREELESVLSDPDEEVKASARALAQSRGI